MTFLTYSQILQARKDNYDSMIIMGYPFDRSTALLAAEVERTDTCFIIDFTGDFPKYFHGDAVILNPNEISCYTDIETSNRYYIDLSFLEQEDRYVNLVYIMSYHLELPIYIIGFDPIDQHILDLINRCDSRVLVTTPGCDKMDPVMILSIKTLFPDIMVAGKTNIRMFYGDECVPETGNVVFEHSGNMFCVTEKKDPDWNPNTQDVSFNKLKDGDSIVIGPDLILDEPSVLLKFKDQKVIIPGSYIGYLAELKKSGGIVEKFQANKALKVIEDLSGTDRIEIEDYNDKLYKTEGFRMELMETEILSLALVKDALLLTNDPDLSQKAELIHVRMCPYPYLMVHVR